VSEVAARMQAVRTGVRLESATVAWMAVEAILAVAAGVAARSVLLTAFGADSLIELASGVTLLWRLRTEASDRDTDRVEAVERRAIRVSAVLLVLLCVYLVVSSGTGLILQVGPQRSWLGVGVAAAALVVMPLLAWRKGLANRAIGSSALSADVAETTTCAYMAGTTLLGLLLDAITGLWWVEYVACLVLLFWLVRETGEALQAARGGRGRCGCD